MTGRFLVLGLCLLTFTVNGEEYICSGIYQDGSATVASTFERDGTIGFNVTVIESSEYQDSPSVKKKFYENRESRNRKFFVENGKSIGFLEHDLDVLVVHWIEFEDMGYVYREIYGGRQVATLSDGTPLSGNDMNTYYVYGSCTKNE